MKTYIFSVLMLLGFSLFAQTIKIPPKVESAFKKEYPHAAAIEWQQTTDKYKVTFTDDSNLHHTVIYYPEGKLFSREREMDEQQVPKVIRDYYAENLPDEQSYRVWQVEDESGKITYYSPVKNAVIFFDEKGKFSHRDERTPENMDQK
jgi:hypothetical protein